MTVQPKMLFVLRHAKSSWEEPGLEDHDRPLAPRGQRAAKLIAEHLRAGEIAPALVLCSSARRARETFEAVAPAGEVVVEPGLYRADQVALIERLRAVPAQTASVMLIGHNPSLQMLVSQLADDRDREPEEALAAVRRKFPTGALATLELSCDWSALAPKCAKLVAFVRPKDLEVA